MKSTKQMINRCEGLVDTKDLSEWENTFLKSLVTRSKDTAWKISEKQHDTLQRIYNQHFGDQ